MLSSGRFDHEAFERAKKERQIEYQQVPDCCLEEGVRVRTGLPVASGQRRRQRAIGVGPFASLLECLSMAS